jgi:hypothetical protein
VLSQPRSGTVAPQLGITRPASRWPVLLMYRGRRGSVT